MSMQSNDVIDECGCYSGIGPLLTLSSMPRRLFSMRWFAWVRCGCCLCCGVVWKHLSGWMLFGCGCRFSVVLSRSAVQMFRIRDCCNCVVDL